MAMEDQTEDGDEEQELNGQDGLHHGQIPETQGRALQDELHQEQGGAQQPYPPLEGIGEEAQAHGVGGRGTSTPMRWSTPATALHSAADAART